MWGCISYMHVRPLQCGAELQVGSRWGRPGPGLALPHCWSAARAPKCPTWPCQLCYKRYIFVRVKIENIFYLTGCRLDLHISNIYTDGRGTSIWTLAMSSACIRGSPKSKFPTAYQTKCIHLLSSLSQSK